MTRIWARNATAPRSRRTPRPHVECLEDRCLLDADAFRSLTGFGNNEAQPEWGATVDANGNPVALLRIADAAYADGFNAPVVGSPTRPSPRVVSNAIVDQPTPDRVFSDRLMSAMIYGWGQFLDHDLDLTTGSSPALRFDIPVPKGDPTFDFFGPGNVVLP